MRGLETRENLGLRQKYIFRKGKSAVESDPKKNWSGVETKGGVKKEELELKVSLTGIHLEERCLTFAWIERNAPVLRPPIKLNQSFLCGLRSSRNPAG